MQLYHSELASSIWTWCALGRTLGVPPPVCGLAKPELSSGSYVVPLDPWDHLGCCVTHMLAVYATATVVVTVAAGTRCAWYGLMGPLDAEQSLPGPGT